MSGEQISHKIAEAALDGNASSRYQSFEMDGASARADIYRKFPPRGISIISDFGILDFHGVLSLAGTRERGGTAQARIFNYEHRRLTS
jgi:hypothetical protein